MSAPHETPAFSGVERAVINRLQHGLPLTPHPFEDVARELGISEQTLLDTLARLLELQEPDGRADARTSKASWRMWVSHKRTSNE